MVLQYCHNCSFLEIDPNQQIQTSWKPGQEQRFEGIGATYTLRNPQGEILLKAEPNKSPSESGTQPLLASVMCTRLLFSRTACRSSTLLLFQKPIGGVMSSP